MPRPLVSAHRSQGVRGGQDVGDLTRLGPLCVELVLRLRGLHTEERRDDEGRRGRGGGQGGEQGAQPGRTRARGRRFRAPHVRRQMRSPRPRRVLAGRRVLRGVPHGGENAVVAQCGRGDGRCGPGEADGVLGQCPHFRGAPVAAGEVPLEPPPLVEVEGVERVRGGERVQITLAQTGEDAHAAPPPTPRSARSDGGTARMGRAPGGRYRTLMRLLPDIRAAA